MLQELVSKLPPYYQIIWGSTKLNLQQNNIIVNLLEFSNWIFDIGLSDSTVNFENNMTADNNAKATGTLFLLKSTELAKNN